MAKKSEMKDIFNGVFDIGLWAYSTEGEEITRKYSSDRQWPSTSALF